MKNQRKITIKIIRCRKCDKQRGLKDVGILVKLRYKSLWFCSQCWCNMKPIDRREIQNGNVECLKMKFPNKTLEKMITIVKSKTNIFMMSSLLLSEKLNQIKEMKNINKKNRWFGYYQKVGEDLGFWTLDEIIMMVRKERDENK